MVTSSFAKDTVSSLKTAGRASHVHPDAAAALATATSESGEDDANEGTED